MAIARMNCNHNWLAYAFSLWPESELVHDLSLFAQSSTKNMKEGKIKCLLHFYLSAFDFEKFNAPAMKCLTAFFTDDTNFDSNKKKNEVLFISSAYQITKIQNKTTIRKRVYF